jgi:hypothetical protein
MTINPLSAFNMYFRLVTAYIPIAPPPKGPESQHFTNQVKNHHYRKVTVQSFSYKHSARFLKHQYLTFCSRILNHCDCLSHSNMASVNIIPQLIWMTRKIFDVFESDMTITGLHLDISKAFWSWVRFPALPDFLRSTGSGTGSTQPREDNRGSAWKKK